MLRQQVDICSVDIIQLLQNPVITPSQEWTAADTATLNIASLHYITAACAQAQLVYNMIILILMIISLYH